MLDETWHDASFMSLGLRHGEAVKLERSLQPNEGHKYQELHNRNVANYLAREDRLPWTAVCEVLSSSCFSRDKSEHCIQILEDSLSLKSMKTYRDWHCRYTMLQLARS